MRVFALVTLLTAVACTTNNYYLPPDDAGDAAATDAAAADATDTDTAADTGTDASLDGGTGPSVAYSSDFSGTYIAICMTDLAPSVSTSFRYAVDTTYVAPTNGSGHLGMVFTPLVANKTKFSAADKVEGPADLGQGTVDASGVATLQSSKMFVIAAAANPISGSPIQGSSMKLVAELTARTRFCGHLDMQLQQPFVVATTAPCLFFALNEGDAIPTLVDADMHCP